jgi:hypothetical protein
MSRLHPVEAYYESSVRIGPMLSLEEIESEITRLARRIGASDDVLPTFGFSEQSGRPHIEVDESGYQYVVTERGQEFERLTTHDLDELLYHVFQDVTSTLALDYELKHRVERRDGRRIAFQQQIELLSALSPEWAKRRRLEHTQILRDRPFDDDASVRATLTKELRDQGHTPEDARRLARNKYPEPSG